MLVLHRHHRHEVVQGEVARVFDAQAERLLRSQRGRRAGHAALDQVALERVADAADHVRVAAQQERHQSQRATGVFGRWRQRAGQAVRRARRRR